MDFFQRLGNWLGGKGWINDEEKRRKEQQVTPVTPQPPQSQSQTHQSVRPSQPQHSFLKNRQGYQRQTQTKLPTQQTATQVANTSAMETRRHPRFDWNEPKPQATSNPYKPRVAPTQDEADRMPKMLSPEGQQEWIKKDRAQKRIEEDIRRKQQEQAKPKKPGFLDFLNPFGEHGIFGAKQQKLVKETIEKPIKSATSAYENWVDSSDKQRGFQWNDLGDYLRFAAKLPSGMVTGLAEAPNKIANTITGKRVADDGKVENLNWAQRFGSGVDALISTGGLATGGSGTLIRSITSQGAKQAAKQGLTQTVVNGVKNLAKDAAKEGLEEGVQTFAQDLSNDGKINTDWRNYRDAVTMGALGGSVMHGAGKGVSAVRNAYRGHANTPAQSNPYREADKASVKLADLERNAARQLQFDRHNATLPLKDIEFNQGAVERLAKGLEHGTAEDIAFIRMRPELLEEVNAIRASYGMKPLKTNEVTAFKGAVNSHLHNRVSEGMTPNAVAYTAADALINPESKALPGTKSRDGYDRSHIQMAVSPEGRKYNTATIAGFNDRVSLKNVVPRSEAELKNALQQRKDILSTQGGETGAVPPSTMVTNDPAGGVSFSARQSGDGTNIAKTGENVNGATQDIPQLIREAAHRHDTAQGFVKEQEENLLAYATDRSAVDAGHRQWIKSFVNNPRAIQSVAEGGVNSMEFPNGEIVMLGTRDVLMRVDPEYMKQQGVTGVQEVRIGRGKTGNAQSGQPRLILSGKMSLDDTVRRNIAFEQHVVLYEQLRGKRQESEGTESPVTDSSVESEASMGGSHEGGEINNNQPTEQPFGSSRYAQEMAQAQEAARRGERPTLRERWQDFKEDMREKFVDRFAPIEDKIVNEAERLEMRNSLDRVLRADGIAEAFVRDNHLDEVIHSFSNKREMQMFDQALIAKHAIELEKNGVTTGRDIAKDKALINEAEKLFAPQFAQVRNYSRRMLQQTVDYGLISQETADYLRQKYPEYVPFDRIFSESELDARSGRGRIEGEASLSKQDIVQRIKGSTRQIDSPLNALVMKTQAMVQQGERNVTAKMLASYADDPKNPFQLRELEAGEQANGRPTISYLDAGTKRTFIAAPEVARAAKNMNREQMGVILRAVAVPARVLRMGATSVNAGFTMANVVKDYVGATINSKNSISAMNPKTFVDALEAAFHHKGDTYLDMQRAGVLGNSYEIARNASQLNLAEIRSHRNFWTRAAHSLKSPLKTLENTIGRSEDFGRAMQFISNKKAAMRQGMSEADAIKFAADQARWNSTNFMRHGTYGKAINAIVPYSNAGIQGQRIMMRRFKENPKRYTAKVMIGVVAPTAAALAYSYASDDGKEVMKNLPDYVKENNVVIVSPGATYDKEQNRWNGVYLIPVPPQYLPLHRQVHAATKHVMTGQGIEVGKSIGDAIEQVTTVNPTEMHRTAAQYTPQAAKPFVENFANKNLFTGQQIVPDGMKNLEAKDQWDNNTSLTARKLGEAMGVSPKKIDNFFRTSTAGGGQNLLYGTDWAIAKATGASDDEIKGRSMMDSIIGRFYGPKGTSQGSYYYESLEKSAKDNKLVGNDLEFFQALTTRKFNENGRAEGKTDAGAMRNSRVLADTPNVAKAISDAAKWRAAQTGEELDPLYKLPLEHQRYYYHIQGSAKNSAEQRDLKNKAPWLHDLQKARSAYFKRQDVKSENSKRISYPEASPELEAIQDKYYSMPKGPEKWAFLDAHPELTEHWARVEEYGNKVREAQGYAPQRTRPQPSEYVKMQMANKNWRDPAVSKYLQDMNIYNITNSASLAEMQGNELDPKALKAIQNLGKYGLVKNPDGTFALKNVDEQGTGVSNIQPGAYDPGVRSWGGYRRRGGSGGAVVAARSNEASKVANSTAMSLSSLAKNRPQLRNVQFTARAADLRQFMRGRNAGKPRKSRAVTFH